jgi:hypothetical protein
MDNREAMNKLIKNVQDKVELARQSNNDEYWMQVVYEVQKTIPTLQNAIIDQQNLVNSISRYAEKVNEIEKTILVKSLNDTQKELAALKQDMLSGVQKIKEVQAKKKVSVKELSILYPDMSPDTQKSYRQRLHDPLPYHQKVEGGKISYVVEEVENWKQNQHK